MKRRGDDSRKYTIECADHTHLAALIKEGVIAQNHPITISHFTSSRLSSLVSIESTSLTPRQMRPSGLRPSSGAMAISSVLYADQPFSCCLPQFFHRFRKVDLL